MAVVVNDTFTDTATTNLTAHTGELGATWTKQTGVTGNLVISNANRVRTTTADADVAYEASGVPATNEYDVECDFYCHTSIAGHYTILWGRKLTTAKTGYSAEIWVSEGSLNLCKFVNGAQTILGSFSMSLSDATSYHIKLEIRTAAKKVFVDGVERISSANDDLTDTGRGGIAVYCTTPAPTDSTGTHFDNFVVTDLTVAAGGQGQPGFAAWQSAVTG